MGGLTSTPAPAGNGVESPASVFLRFFFVSLGSGLEAVVGVFGRVPLAACDFVGEGSMPMDGCDGHCGTPSAPG